jgi:hypothetical protein
VGRGKRSELRLAVTSQKIMATDLHGSSRIFSLFDLSVLIRVDPWLIVLPFCLRQLFIFSEIKNPAFVSPKKRRDEAGQFSKSSLALVGQIPRGRGVVGLQEVQELGGYL